MSLSQVWQRIFLKFLGAKGSKKQQEWNGDQGSKGAAEMVLARAEMELELL